MTTEQMLNELARSIYEGNAKQGFWENERNTGEMLMLIVTELSECLEAHREGRHAKWADYDALYNSEAHRNNPEYKNTVFKNQVKDTFEDELADAVIRIFDMAGGLGINIGKHIMHKLAYNATRQYKHWKKY